MKVLGIVCIHSQLFIKLLFNYRIYKFDCFVGFFLFLLQFPFRLRSRVFVVVVRLLFLATFVIAHLCSCSLVAEVCLAVNTGA
jgi:hypothetical protein